ncbi:MAG: hypothetical protein N2Z22_05855 [Turneriella sp.]|nr:hypothetical protein [Turneriella sp.]
MADLAAAFALFREGRFSEARAAALQLAEQNPQPFWPFYLAAVASAFAGEVRAFEEYLEQLIQNPLPEGRVYLHYLEAYYALLARDIEKALWHYLQIAESPEGWLAKALLRKFRKMKSVENPAFHAADYIVLPEVLPPPPRDSKVDKAEAKGWQYAAPAAKKAFSFKFNISQFSRTGLLVGVLVVVFSVSAIFYFYLYRGPKHVPTPVSIPPLEVASSAAVMPVSADFRPQYLYRTRDAIIRDFDQAKEFLRQKKINQCRYLLQRILVSNADFQTREKSRTFLGFIPDLPYHEFNDNLALPKLLAEPALWSGSLVVIAGELRDANTRAGYTTYHFVAREGAQEYLLTAFRENSIPEEKLETESGKKYIQVYGRFRGLTGPQRVVQLEVLRVWR